MRSKKVVVLVKLSSVSMLLLWLHMCRFLLTAKPSENEEDMSMRRAPK